jgi:peptidoglycan/xylan/chitin deacetylase (PgdA/CDA1 family)
VKPSFRSQTTRTAKTLLFNAGVCTILRRLAPSRQIAVLRYHAVCEGNAGYAAPGICVAPAHFEQHVAYLAGNYRVLPLPEAAAAIGRGTSLPSNAVVITFDDGYGDNFAAAQVLARYGLTATFYITAGCLADGAPFWPAELRTLVHALTSARIDLEAGDVRASLPVSTPAERSAAISSLTKIFKAHPIRIREELRQQLRQLAGTTTVPSPMLTWQQVKTMHRMGMDIGSHTLTHPNLPNAGLEDARREIVESKRLLEEQLNAPVTMFSYPNGGAERYMTPAVAGLVREAGYAAAATSRNAFAGAGSDLFALERVQVAERLEHLIFALEVERFAFKPKPRPGEMQ